MQTEITTNIPSTQLVDVPSTIFEKTPLGWAWVKSDYSIQLPKHLRIISKYLHLLAYGYVRYLIINAPPGHGKSDLVSKYFPAWYLDQPEFLNNRFMLISYGAEFAAEWGRKVRDLKNEFGNFPLAGDSKAAHRWNLEGYLGGMYTTGMNGSVTGRRVHIMAIDDPVKNNTDALSITQGQKDWDWLTGTAMDRLEPGAGFVMSMQRWTDKDLTGRLLEHLKRKGLPFVHLNFPAIAYEGEEDICGRKSGEPLWEERYDREALEEKRLMLLDWWMPKYQQRPRKITDESVDPLWFKKKKWNEIAPDEVKDEKAPNGIRLVPKLSRFVRYVDMAAKSTSGNRQHRGDYMAGVLSCRDKDMRFGILHSRRMRAVVSVIEDALVEFIVNDYEFLKTLGVPSSKFIESYSFWFESDKAGTGEIAAAGITRMIASRLQDRGVPAPSIQYEHPSGNKRSRAFPMFMQAKAGNYWILDGTWDVDGFLERLCLGMDANTEDEEGHDDEMDAASGGYSKMMKVGAPPGTKQLWWV